MKELTARKNMRLSGCDYSQNGAYFLTICVKDKHEMLGRIGVGSDDLGAPHAILSEYGTIVEKYILQIEDHYNVALEKYVIMPNHIHMIIRVKDGVPRSSRPTMLIPTIIAALKKMINKSIGFSMWQRSYHDHIIRNEADYQRIWAYIDENPARLTEDCYYTP